MFWKCGDLSLAALQEAMRRIMYQHNRGRDMTNPKSQFPRPKTQARRPKAAFISVGALCQGSLRIFVRLG